MESHFVAWLRERLPPHARLRVGAGDDAAVLRLGHPGECVVTVDTITDGVDFRLAEVDPRRIGHKALAVNLSDLAAMAARPVAVVVSVVVPRSFTLETLQTIYAGLLELAARFDVAVAGGDTNAWDGALAISVTAIGETTARGPLLRSGAKPGDWLLVTGELGGSILGKHLDFEPRVREALLLHERYTLHAGMDISDGLSLDLGRLCDESSVGAELDLAALPISAAARQLAARAGDATTAARLAIEHALGDGEDFELLLAVPPEAAARLLADQPLKIPVTKIGQFVAARGLWSLDAAGERTRLPRRGFEHQWG